MKLKSIFKKTPVIKPEVKETASQIKPEVPEGLLKRCNKCGKGIFTEDYKKNLYICPKCGGYLRMPAQKRIEFLTEADSFEEWDTGLSTENPLHMIGYPDKIKALQDKTKLTFYRHLCVKYDIKITTVKNAEHCLCQSRALIHINSNRNAVLLQSRSKHGTCQLALSFQIMESNRSMIVCNGYMIRKTLTGFLEIL